MLVLPEDLVDILQFDAATHAVASREGKRREFKRDFVRADFSDYTKAIAAFANADGGILLFGIGDKPRELVGVEVATLPDEAEWSDRLRQDFDPEIPISTKLYSMNGMSIFAVGVEASPNRPVICRRVRTKSKKDKAEVSRDVEVLREGAIYYRYSAQTRAIAYNELSAMLADRERKWLQQIMETMKVVQQIGVGQTGVVDLKAGATSHVFISRETAKDLKLIDRGKLVQAKGAPAYVVSGQVRLADVVHAPLDEADKNLPSEVARTLRPLVREVYGAGQTIHQHAITPLLKHLNIYDDQQYCVHERKLKRKYITRRGVSAIAEFIRARPLEALKKFGSRQNIARYQAVIAPKVAG